MATAFLYNIPTTAQQQSHPSFPTHKLRETNSKHPPNSKGKGTNYHGIIIKAFFPKKGVSHPFKNKKARSMYTSNKNVGHISDTIKHFPAIKNTLFLGSRHVRQRGLQSNPPTNQVSRISHQVIFKMKDGNKKKKAKVWEKPEKNIKLHIPSIFFFPFSIIL